MGILYTLNSFEAISGAAPNSDAAGRLHCRHQASVQGEPDESHSLAGLTKRADRTQRPKRPLAVVLSGQTAIPKIEGSVMQAAEQPKAKALFDLAL